MTDGVSKARSFCGTPEYIAPEIVKEEVYTKMVDYWALGCLVYELLAGNSPFRGSNNSMSALFKRITAVIFTQKGKYPIPHHFDEFSRDLVAKLLVQNVSQVHPACGATWKKRHPRDNAASLLPGDRLREASQLPDRTSA
jgi:serine/threonine protein kinase